MREEFEVDGLSDLREAAERISGLIERERCNLVLLRGPMGAGKTTFTKALCEARGVEDTVTSPTFALINEYRDAAGKRICHFDFYRIGNLKEVMDLGYEEYFYSGDLCLVEWPEKIEELIPGPSEPGVRVAELTIEPAGRDRRKLVFAC